MASSLYAVSPKTATAPMTAESSTSFPTSPSERLLGRYREWGSVKRLGAFGTHERQSPFPKEGWAWGIDPGMSNAAICAVNASGHFHIVSSKLEDSPGALLPDRLHRIGTRARAMAGFLHRTHPPSVIAIELPTGKHKPAITGASFGAIDFAVWDKLQECLSYPPEHWSVTPSAWKSATVGVGNADKGAVLMWTEETTGNPFPNQHEADAFCIATWALREFEKAR
jgi:Holliday junction resolvasome RuvABC endonuclease subunit